MQNNKFGCLEQSAMDTRGTVSLPLVAVQPQSHSCVLAHNYEASAHSRRQEDDLVAQSSLPV
jgi:hypothetical protein